MCCWAASITPKTAQVREGSNAAMGQGTYVFNQNIIKH